MLERKRTLEVPKEKNYKCGKCGEVQQYGFWFRFLSENFIPCEKCQETLHEILNTSILALNDSFVISLKRLPLHAPVWMFFGLPNEPWEPCRDCQSWIEKMWQKSEMHIGNGNKPMVELWRKWEIKDE